MLNEQTLVGEEEAHATAVGSVVGAPVNGVGIVGVYPQAALRAYDASPSDAIDEAAVIRGIVLASQAGRGVINLSLGSADRSEFMADAIVLAFGRGSIVVVAAGNQFENGNPLSYPANDPHVLTVGATTEGDRPAAFSSASAALDLAAPGVDIPAAVPLVDDPTGYTTVDGTSFSSPLVAGATAWVWTVRPTLETTQVFDLMRLSAKDIWSPGWDRDTGFGLLDIPSALTQAPPPVDPLEPNDDIDQVKARGLFAVAKPLVKGTLKARAAAVDDPDDVYRVNVPAHATLTATIKPDANLNLRLWGPLTRSVSENGIDRVRDLLASSSRSGHAGRRRPLDEQGQEGGRPLRGRLLPAGKHRAPGGLLADGQDRARSAVAAACSTGTPSCTSGLRTRTRTRSTGNRAITASATAAESASRSWNLRPSETPRTHATTSR